jgi:hypothetical protein
MATVATIKATTTKATETTVASSKGEIATGRLPSDWYYHCKCNIPCHNDFAPRPTFGEYEGILVYDIKEGIYTETPIDDLNMLAMSSFEGNI